MRKIDYEQKMKNQGRQAEQFELLAAEPRCLVCRGWRVRCSSCAVSRLPVPSCPARFATITVPQFKGEKYGRLHPDSWGQH
jgi:hypothetical protein